jgi:hypothetical protein
MCAELSHSSAIAFPQVKAHSEGQHHAYMALGAGPQLVFITNVATCVTVAAWVCAGLCSCVLPVQCWLPHLCCAQGMHVTMQPAQHSV